MPIGYKTFFDFTLSIAGCECDIYVVVPRKVEAESRVVVPRESLDSSTQVKSKSSVADLQRANQPNVAHPCPSHAPATPTKLGQWKFLPHLAAGIKLACLTLQPPVASEHRCLFDAGNQSQWPVCCPIAVRIPSCRNNGILIIFNRVQELVSAQPV